jgi:hypothetical protein
LKYSKGETATSLGRLEEWSKGAEGAERLREREDAALEAAGFEQIGADLWAKGDVCYGREAALQKVNGG